MNSLAAESGDAGPAARGAVVRADLAALHLTGNDGRGGAHLADDDLGESAEAGFRLVIAEVGT